MTIGEKFVLVKNDPATVEVAGFSFAYQCFSGFQMFIF